MTNMPMPTCHRRLRCGGRRTSCGPFSSSRMCDLRCRVSPSDWTLVESRPTITPICRAQRRGLEEMVFLSGAGGERWETYRNAPPGRQPAQRPHSSSSLLGSLDHLAKVADEKQARPRIEVTIASLSRDTLVVVAVVVATSGRFLLSAPVESVELEGGSLVTFM